MLPSLGDRQDAPRWTKQFALGQVQKFKGKKHFESVLHCSRAECNEGSLPPYSPPDKLPHFPPLCQDSGFLSWKTTADLETFAIRPSSALCQFCSINWWAVWAFLKQRRKVCQQYLRPQRPADTVRTTQTCGRKGRPQSPPGTGHHLSGGCWPLHWNLQPAAWERTRTQKEQKYRSSVTAVRHFLEK